MRRLWKLRNCALKSSKGNVMALMTRKLRGFAMEQDPILPSWKWMEGASMSNRILFFWKAISASKANTKHVVFQKDLGIKDLFYGMIVVWRQSSSNFVIKKVQQNYFKPLLNFFSIQKNIHMTASEFQWDFP